MKFSMLPQPLGLLKLILDLQSIINGLGRELNSHFFRFFKNIYFSIGLHWELIN